MKPFKAWVLVHKLTGEVRSSGIRYAVYPTRAEARYGASAPMADSKNWKPVRVEVTPCSK
jgi:hypothetical protein